MEGYLGKCVAPATRAAYASAQRRCANFCQQFTIGDPYPLSEGTLCRFVAFLAHEGLKHRTIKAYLSGLRFAQIHHDLGNPFVGNLPRLEYVLAGVKRSEAHTSAAPKPRLPITIEILQQLKAIWLTTLTNPEGTLLWAATCTGFFGFLRAGEFTVPSGQSYDPEVHLNLADIAVDSHIAPSLIRLRIKQSKTDPFRQGDDIFLGATGSRRLPSPSYDTVSGSSQPRTRPPLHPPVRHTPDACIPRLPPARSFTAGWNPILMLQRPQL